MAMDVDSPAKADSLCHLPPSRSAECSSGKLRGFHASKAASNCDEENRSPA